MAALVYAGIPEQDTVGIIKKISKKNKAGIDAAKEQFIDGFIKKMMKRNETLSYDEAMEISLRIWKVIEDSARYSSNN